MASRVLGQTRAISNRTSGGYKGFGFFHLNNVEELVDAACNEECRAPPLPQLVTPYAKGGCRRVRTRSDAGNEAQNVDR